MKNLTGNALKAALILAVPITICTAVYLAYSQQEPVSKGNFMLSEDTGLWRNDAVKLSRFQALINKQLDSIAQSPTGNLLGSFYNDVVSDTLPDSTSIARQNDSFPTHNEKAVRPDNIALHGPSALFTKTYSLAIGKPVPVNVLWTPDSAVVPAKFQLVTITLNDVANDKAGFTLADPFAVLLYSGANYAVDDKILIEDERHNLHISVLQVHPDSVTIEFASLLTDNIVSKLRESD